MILLIKSMKIYQKLFLNTDFQNHIASLNFNELTHCGLVMPYGIWYQGQHTIR